VGSAGGSGGSEGGDCLGFFGEPLVGEAEDSVVILCRDKFESGGVGRERVEGVLAGDGGGSGKGEELAAVEGRLARLLHQGQDREAYRALTTG